MKIINKQTKIKNINKKIFHSQAERKLTNTNNETTNTQNYSKDLIENLKDSTLNLYSLNNKILFSNITPICRICYEKDKKNDLLIIPCKCEGTIKYVHQSCIKKWIINSNNCLENPICEICKSKFLIKIDNSIYLDKKKLLKAVLIIILILLIFIGLFFVVYFVLLSSNLIIKIPKRKLLDSFIIFLIVLIILSSYPLYHFCQRNCYSQKLDFEVLSIKRNLSVVKLSKNNQKRTFETNNKVLFYNYINQTLNSFPNHLIINKNNKIGNKNKCKE